MSNFDQRELRNAYGRFMTGVVVVITQSADGTPVGFTANSFSSVSLTPPLISVCPGNFLSSYQTFSQCYAFTVSILSADQQSVAETFARFKGDRFEQVDWQSGDVTGLPVILNASATFECTTHQIIPAGDHVILMGQVEAFADHDRPGLGYGGGGFFKV